MISLPAAGILASMRNLCCVSLRPPTANAGCHLLLTRCAFPFALQTGVTLAFVQTFVLAQQPNGYYVLNDIMHLRPEAKPAANGYANAEVRCMNLSAHFAATPRQPPPPLSRPEALARLPAGRDRHCVLTA